MSYVRALVALLISQVLTSLITHWRLARLEKKPMMSQVEQDLFAKFKAEAKRLGDLVSSQQAQLAAANDATNAMAAKLAAALAAADNTEIDADLAGMVDELKAIGAPVVVAPPTDPAPPPVAPTTPAS